ncbi:cell division inhibitor SepF [Blastococcus aurantiacus]|uniref:Cell division protein SepF n=1 Tax=Blastococcus aurantiacus TaxID=1550231 RepID=A0A1G7M292_9ACTN|nr:cell division protein SepF [Blastococcus aurantiacus]SDF55867.1 cell division inhibitor SepF [Blastococcus aurantiacus]
MAGAMRRMGIYLGLVEDDDARGYGRYDVRQSDHPDPDRRYGRYEDDHYDDYAGGDYPAGYADEELPEPAPTRAPEPLSVRRVAPARPLGLAPSGGTGGGASRISAMSSGPVGAAGLAVREPVAAIVPEPAPAPVPAPQPYRITTLHPRTYNEARVIGERFRDGMPVIMNLTEMDDADAKRLVDFAAGLSFGLRGSIERVTAKVFLLSPQNVDVTAEDKARIREGGFFNQS